MAESSNLRCELCLAGGTFKSRCGFPHIHIWHETSSTATTMRGKFTSAGKTRKPHSQGYMKDMIRAITLAMPLLNSRQSLVLTL